SRGPEITGATGQSLRIFEAAKFFRGVDMDIRICAYAEPAISGKKFPRRKNTVTEIGFGYGTKSRDGATRCKPRGFALRHVGCVDQRPGRILPGMVEQP